MTSAEVAIWPLGALEEAHLADGHLHKLLRSVLLPLCTAKFLTLLTVGAGELALAVQDPNFDLETIALVAPAGAPAPHVAVLAHHADFPNTSIYSNVSDLDDLELGHRFGIVMVPNVLLAATAAPRGLPALLRHILGDVLNGRGGVALLGAIPESSVPLHAFLSAVAPGFVDARRLRRLVAEFEGCGVRVATARRRVVWLRGVTPNALHRSLATLACVAGALEGSAVHCVGLGGGGHPGGSPAALGPALHAAMAHVQPMHCGGGLGIPLEIEYLVVTKTGGSEDEAAIGGWLTTKAAHHGLPATL